MNVELHVTEGPAKGQHFSFDTSDCFLVGRAGDAHISLPDDPYLSRQHFLLLISPPDCILMDLDSKNGVFVNGVRYGGRKPPKNSVNQAPAGVREVALQDGDRITVGGTRIQVSIHLNDLPDDQDEVQSVLSDDAVQEFLLTKGFQHIHILCQGSKGPIYRAIEPEKKRDVVVKTLRFPEGADPQKIRRLQAELDLLCYLRHQHIVPLMRYGTFRQCVFCVMEYVHGSDLIPILQLYGTGMPLPEAATLMLELLDGLAYAHTRKVTARTSRGALKCFQGIVHRDLKPQNIFLARSDNRWIPKLADFGLSRGFEIAGFTNITHPKAIGNAPLYWPREQVTHYTRPTLVTDVFALAAIFYQTLTGCLIREGFHTLVTSNEKGQPQASLADYLRIIVNHAPVPIQQRKPDIPPPIAQVLDRALCEEELLQKPHNLSQKLGQMRYPNAHAFREALVKAFQESGVKPTTLSSKSISIPKLRQDFQTDNAVSSRSEVPGSIVYSAFRSSPKREVALLVLDVVQSTHHILEMGDTRFGTLIGQMFKHIKDHPAASELIFLKCTGDGFLGVFYSMQAAFLTAQSFLAEPILPTIHIRMALHWGVVKTGPDGDVLGTEVHKVCRIEGVRSDDLLEPVMEKDTFPLENRILISKQGLAQLSETLRTRFAQVGKFRLKGFQKLYELWVYSG